MKETKKIQTTDLKTIFDNELTRFKDFIEILSRETNGLQITFTSNGHIEVDRITEYGPDGIASVTIAQGCVKDITEALVAFYERKEAA